MPDPSERRVAIVTGATRDAGIAIASRLFTDGFSIVGCGRSQDAGRAAAKALDKSGERSAFVACDLGDEQQITALVDATVGSSAESIS